MVFFVFWHLQLAPDCQLTLRNRCCPSVCHRLLFLSLLSRVCALLSRVCALAKPILMCLWLCPFELPCNESINTCLQTVAVNCVSLYCICKDRFLRLLCLIPKMRRSWNEGPNRNLKLFSSIWHTWLSERLWNSTGTIEAPLFSLLDGFRTHWYKSNHRRSVVLTSGDCEGQRM